MYQVIYERLKEVAKSRRTITYSELAPLARLNMSNAPDRTEIARILDEISNYEYDHGRPLLSAVVIRKDTNLPGSGFFTLARELGLLTGDDKDGFYRDELNRVYEIWTNS